MFSPMFLRRLSKTPQISLSVGGTVNAISISRHVAPSTLQWKGFSVGAGNDSELLRRDTFKKVAKIIAPFTVHLHVPPGPYVESKLGSFGSGIVVDQNGTILTCAHVVTNNRHLKSKAYQKSTKTVRVWLSDGTQYPGVTFSYDAANDLALVKIKPKAPLTAAKAGDVSEICAGDFVMSGGSPRGWPFSFSKGIMSSLNRTHKAVRDRGDRGNIYIQTDCAISQGSSGGPIVNLNGEVIGVTIAGAVPGIGFAIRIDTVLKVLKKMGFEDSLSFTRAKGAKGPSGSSRLPSSRTRNK